MPRLGEGNGTGPHRIPVEEPPPLERAAKTLQSWQVLAGIVLALVLAGATAAAYMGRLATKADVTAMVSGAVADHGWRGDSHLSLVTRADDHEHRIRTVEEDAAASARDREWIVSTLAEMARHQRLDVPPPPARAKKPR